MFKFQFSPKKNHRFSFEKLIYPNFTKNRLNNFSLEKLLNELFLNKCENNKINLYKACIPTMFYYCTYFY